MNMPEAEQSVLIEAPPEKVYAVIVDYAAYPEFVPKMRKAEVLESRGNVSVVRFHIKMIKDIVYVLKLTGKPSREVIWNLLESNIFTSNTGSWRLRKQGAGTLATYRLGVSVNLFVPGFIIDKLVSVGLPEVLEQFKRRAEKEQRHERRSGGKKK